MTLAIDRTSGKVLGQVCTLAALEPFVSSTRYALTADDVDNGPFLYLLTRDGYQTVRRNSVRVEEVR